MLTWNDPEERRNDENVGAVTASEEVGKRLDVGRDLLVSKE
jgi:hypothetical protein